MRLFVSVFMAFLLATPAVAKPPAFDPRSWKGAQDGPPTQVLTIGSTHLSQLKNVVTPPMLAPLLDKLAAYGPTVITHEGLSGEQCDTLKRYPVKYPGMFDTYCWPTDDAEKATGLDIPAAMAEIDKEMASWPAQPSAVQRRHLAAVFIAAGDRPSAYVQWLQLPVEERKLGDGIDPAMLKILTRSAPRPNETFDIAAALAVRLGLQRIYAVDDHTADVVQALAGPGFDAYMTQFWEGAKSAAVDEDRRQSEAMTSGAELLAFYRLINRPASQREYVTVDYHRAMSAHSPENYGRAYLAWWEVRNLRMVSNIRTAFANHPGARVLNIVGSSHKAYYDAYLDMMSDVTVIDAEQVLK
ncbi:DUF5694 domain-containing protein [Novosphingobium lentum]|uniref:DUF5694 domain-containing protein n=1 Tax=Novosphingobium lentum TaxID=145287 RepID=UPI0008333D94|nr:DUF5694 domain-containing protein [Novosphingobium lentum]